MTVVILYWSVQLRFTPIYCKCHFAFPPIPTDVRSGAGLSRTRALHQQTNGRPASPARGAAAPGDARSAGAPRKRKAINIQPQPRKRPQSKDRKLGGRTDPLRIQKEVQPSIRGGKYCDGAERLQSRQQRPLSFQQSRIRAFSRREGLVLQAIAETRIVQN